MKKNFFNITKAFLLGLALVAVGCSDYDEDIKDLNNRIDAVTSQITGEIDLTKVDLEKTKATLAEAKDALAALQVKHDADINALKASDETLKSSIAEANAAIVALKGDLSAAEAALNNKVDGVQAELNSKIAAEIATVEEKIAAANAQIEGLKQNVSELNTKDAELDKKIADLDEDMAALNTELSTLISKNAEGVAANAADIKALQETMAQYAATFAEYQAAVAGQIAGLEAKDSQIESSIATINDAITRIDASLENKVDKSNFEAFKAEAAAQYAILQDAVERIEDLEYNLSQLKKEDKTLNERIQKFKSELTEEINKAFGNIAANTDAIVALQGEVNKNKASIEATNNSLNSAIAQITEEIEKLQAKDIELDAKNAELAAQIVANYAALETADAKIVEKINAEVEKLIAADDAISATVAANYAELSTKAADLQDQANMLLMVNGILTAENKAQAAALEAQAADIKKVADDLLANYNELKQADADAAETFAQLLAKSDADQANEFAEVYKALDETNKELADKYKELAADDAELAKWIANVSGTVDKNAVRIDKLDSSLADLMKEYESYKKNIDKALLDLKNDLYDAKGEIVKLEEKTIAALEAQKKSLQEEIVAANEAIEAVKKELQTNIDKLAKRIQSIVYVPEYSDGKATIEYATFAVNTTAEDGTTTSETKYIEYVSEMTYQVYPAECAALLTAENLSFIVKDVKTRATEAAPKASLTIKDVKAGAEEGTVVITVAARNFDKSFYADQNPMYSASLVLNYKGDVTAETNLSSCYTNLIAQSANSVNAITVKLNADKKEDIAIPYTKRHSASALEEPATLNLLEGSNVRYVIDETEYTYAEMIAAGYAVEAPVFSYTVAGYTADAVASDDAVALFSCDNIYSPVDAEEATVLAAATDFNAEKDLQAKVWLTEKAIATTVGSYITYTAKYNVMGQELSAEQNVIIDPHTVEITANVDDIVWNYAQDAAQDAAGDAAHYVRNNLVLDFDATMEDINKALDLEDLVLKDVIAKSAQRIRVSIDGGKTYKAPANYICYNNADEGDAKHRPTLANNEDGTIAIRNFAGYEWNKDYILEYTYLNNKSVKVVIYVNVKTVDRSREVITIEASDEVVLSKNIKFAAFDGATEVMSLAKIYTDIKEVLKYNIGDFTQEDFLKEVLATEGKAYETTANLKAVAGDNKYESVIGNKWSTNFDVDNEKATASIGFNYATFSFVPETVTYTRDITLWYGQKVQLIYTLNFTKPALYDFVANPLYTIEQDGAYASKVQASYKDAADKEDVATKNLAKFDVKNVNMDQAFYVASVNKLETPLTAEELLVEGLVTKFELEDTYAGIEFDEAGKILAYNGNADYVDVTGKLYLKHDNGAMTELATSFDSNDKFKGYKVMKFDPFTALTAVDYTENIKDVKVYNVNVLSLFDIYESRTGDNVASTPKVDLFDKNGNIFVGTGNNGWANQAKFETVYHAADASIAFSDVNVEINDAYRKVMSWDPDTYVLTFDNTHEMKLQTTIEIPVTLTVNYKWGSKSATTTITFKP